MKHIKGRRTGNQAEVNLIEMLKDNRSKRKYTIRLLDSLSRVQNKYVTRLQDDVDLLKYSLQLNIEKFYRNAESSNLVEDELSHLKNALRARYIKIVRKLEIPLNTGN